MNRQSHAEFWSRYDRVVRPVVERACRKASRLQSEGTMDPGDMSAWVHTRVWRMLEKNTYPTFHDDPTIDEAIDRLLTHAGTLARWSYLALSRKHWRRLEQEAPSDLGRVEHLSVTRRADAEVEHREAIDDALAKVRSALPDSVRQKLAASMQDKGDRKRAALALGVTRREDDRLINQINTGQIKENTVQQMRSRARRHAIEALGQSVRLPVMFLVAASMLFAITPAKGGEQSGGRKGGRGGSAQVVAEGEQSGGRKPGKGMTALTPDTVRPDLFNDEQSGGRGGRP